MKKIRVALLGDFNPQVVAHRAIPRALQLAGDALDLQVVCTWLPTPALEHDAEKRLADFHGLWCVPASPYASLDGALRGIRFARETALPFLGTCGGFQHAVLEIARNVLGLANADHAETNAATELPVIAALACALVEKSGAIFFEQGSRIREIYGGERATEIYHCRYGFSPERQALFAGSDLKITGRDADGEPRVVELAGHPFFIATLFQPERSALTGNSVHPLIRAFVAATAAP
ncbi:MAG: hypothetical protein JO295_09010 [Verrucomicrobia bacterium]|nr:hypothetical protein [Verrucomicrobiota bacterium]